MEASRRMRAGALLGAIAGPPLVLLVVYPLLSPGFVKSGGGNSFPLWLLAILGTWAAGFIGLPLLGACIAAGGWIGRTLGRRLANHCIGGGIAAGALAGVLARVAPALAGGRNGTVLRLILVETGLVVGVVLCFRTPKDPPPA